METEIKAAYERTRQSYGPARLQADLTGDGFHVGVHRINLIRKKLGLRCMQKRKCKATTESNCIQPDAPKPMDGQFAVAAPNKVWATDVTYIATDEGWWCLVGIKDLFNDALVRCALISRTTQQLEMQAHFRAVAAKQSGKDLIQRSDRGSLYCAPAYQKPLRQFAIQTSISRNGNRWDNARWKVAGVR